MTDTAQLYEKRHTIRSFETLLLDEFASGIFPGTTYTSLAYEHEIFSELVIPTRLSPVQRGRR
jgi:hypothetical protein